MVDLDLAAAVQADADLGAGVVERRDRALRQHLRRAGRLVPAQLIDQLRASMRRLRPHDDCHLHALLRQHAGHIESVVAAADHGDVGPEIGAPLAHIRRAEMQPARFQNAPRVVHMVEPLLATK